MAGYQSIIRLPVNHQEQNQFYKTLLGPTGNQMASPTYPIASWRVRLESSAGQEK